MATKLQNCAACGKDWPYNGHGLFTQHPCTVAGTSAVDSANGYEPCPAHNQLVWVLGPYSAYRGCAHPGCTEGKVDKKGNRKPWRYFSPRVTSNGDVTPRAEVKESTESTESTEPSNHTPSTPESPVKATPKTPAPSESGLNLAMLGSLGETIQAYVDARATELATEIAISAVQNLGERAPSTINWTVNSEPFATVEGTHHKALPRLLKLYAAGFRNFLIVGPAGSGKTTLARDFAKALSIRYAGVSCTSGMSESSLTGRAIPNLTTGETMFQSTDFVRLYEAGGVFLLDEVDAADPNVMLVINSALANGHMPIPNRESDPSATRADDSVIMCAANTWGTGADRQYVGRNQLDAAFLDRFVGTTIEVDYDRDLESVLVGDAHICARVWEIRTKVMELRLRRVVGTRFLLSVVRLVKGAGESLDAALTACSVGWTSDERSKVGIRMEAN